METLELKRQLISKIEIIENDKILEEVYRILDIGEEAFEVYKVSEHQRKLLDEANEDIKNGKVTSNEIANKEIEEWLSK